MLSDAGRHSHRRLALARGTLVVPLPEETSSEGVLPGVGVCQAELAVNSPRRALAPTSTRAQRVVGCEPAMDGAPRSPGYEGSVGRYAGNLECRLDVRRTSRWIFIDVLRSSCGRSFMRSVPAKYPTTIRGPTARWATTRRPVLPPNCSRALCPRAKENNLPQRQDYLTA